MAAGVRRDFCDDILYTSSFPATVLTLPPDVAAHPQRRVIATAAIVRWKGKTHLKTDSVNETDRGQLSKSAESPSG